MIVLDNALCTVPRVALHEKVLYFGKEEEQENSSLAHSLLEIASQYYDLSNYVGYEMWCHERNYKRSVYHIDKDEIAYTKEYNKQVLLKLDSLKVWLDLKYNELLYALLYTT